MTSTSAPTYELRGSLRFWLGLAVSAVFLILAVRQVDWARTITTLRAADLRLIGLGTALLLGTFGVFAVRWKVLLSTSARLPVKETFSYIMIGYLANTVLPLRLGDVARATLMGRQHGISASLVFGSVLLERVLDVLTVLVLILSLSVVIEIPAIVQAGMTTFAGGTLAALAVLFVLAFNEHRLPSLAMRLPGFIPHALVERLAGLVARFAGGLHTLRDGRQLGQVLILSGLAWVVAGAGTMFWVKAFHLPAPWYAGFFVLAVVNLGGAIPSSPGAVGVYHYLAVLALSVWVPDRSAVLGYAFGTHGVIMLVNILVGSWCLVGKGIPLQSIGAAHKVIQ